MEHDLPPGPRPIRVMQIGPLENGDGLVMEYQPAACRHCTTPACVAACPRGAMQKKDDEFVISDPEICIGCQTCALACPFGIPQLNPGLGKIAKCNGCAERVDLGFSPACVLACPTEALSFMTPLVFVQKVRERVASALRQFSRFNRG